MKITEQSSAIYIDCSRFGIARVFGFAGLVCNSWFIVSAGAVYSSLSIAIMSRALLADRR
jgi:hypothetical protein